MTAESYDVIGHFSARAATYDQSGGWCTDEVLGEMILAAGKPRATDQVLDVACGTGLVSRLFHGRCARTVGVDITKDMAEQAEQHLDELIITPAEALPFESDSFDIVVCRQGIQFMILPDAVREMVRVAKPGGRIVIVNLCAYGSADRDEYFEVLRLRNPVRRHFFLPEDLERLLTSVGCDPVTLTRFVTTENVDAWSDNGAIGEDRREAIREVYRASSPEFRQLHGVQQEDGHFVDYMLFILACGIKP
jgi:SAM-dependent methyltransferase